MDGICFALDFSENASNSFYVQVVTDLLFSLLLFETNNLLSVLAHLAVHIGCTVDVIYTNCKKAKIKLAAKRHLPKSADVAPKNLSVDYLYKKW